MEFMCCEGLLYLFCFWRDRQFLLLWGKGGGGVGVSGNGVVDGGEVCSGAGTHSQIMENDR